MESGHINGISVFLIALFIMPLISGFFQPLTDNRLFNAFKSILATASFIISAGLAVLITKTACGSDETSGIAALFRRLPVLREAAAGKDVLAYALAFLLLMLLLCGVMQLLLIPVIKNILLPLSRYIAKRLAQSRRFVYRLICAAWQLPKALWLVLLFSLILNVYMTLSVNSQLCDYIGGSKTYRLVETSAIRPIIDSKTAKALPPLIDNAVNRTVDCLSPEGRKLLIRMYINGMPVEDAVRSTPDIDNMAIDLVNAETSDYRKAEILYDWICAQITYDKSKAEMVAVDAFAVTSGASSAFSEKTGICFDKACLYVSMCQAVDVPVRLVTGEGYNGSSWENHSWNQIFDERTSRWVNVDTTFGSSGGNYFDRIGFYNDHRGDELQGEW